MVGSIFSKNPLMTTIGIRVFGNGGELGSLLGFGCMRLPARNGVAGDIDENPAARMVGYAIKRGVNYFDFYLAHNLDAANLRIYDNFCIHDFLKAKRREGCIRHLGFSFHDSVKALGEAVERYDWDFGQLLLKYLDRGVQEAEGQYDALTRAGIPVIVTKPV